MQLPVNITYRGLKNQEIEQLVLRKRPGWTNFAITSAGATLPSNSESHS
jgi:hypothetical protein